MDSLWRDSFRMLSDNIAQYAYCYCIMYNCIYVVDSNNVYCTQYNIHYTDTCPSSICIIHYTNTNKPNLTLALRTKPHTQNSIVTNTQQKLTSCNTPTSRCRCRRPLRQARAQREWYHMMVLHGIIKIFYKRVGRFLNTAPTPVRVVYVYFFQLHSFPIFSGIFACASTDALVAHHWCAIAQACAFNILPNIY